EIDCIHGSRRRSTAWPAEEVTVNHCSECTCHIDTISVVVDCLVTVEDVVTMRTCSEGRCQGHTIITTVDDVVMEFIVVAFQHTGCSCTDGIGLGTTHNDTCEVCCGSCSIRVDCTIPDDVEVRVACEVNAVSV